jgi:2-polyprenyl-3-methyl-5-hydroxy-6-metoxy-1,4-benzoquinol methylase
MVNVKQVIRQALPEGLVAQYYRSKIARNRQKNQAKSTAEIFSEIYQSGEWGNSQDQYDSGTGSSEDRFIQPYCNLVGEFVAGLDRDGLTIVDLGCGDFRVGGAVLAVCESRLSKYIAVDIVPSLIEHNKLHNQVNKVEFVCQNIIDEDLPKGDICFVRQVLQHLSNQQIQQILAKISKSYRYVFITEHQPTDETGVVPNLDKPHGGDIRLFDGSGVYLGKPPFVLENCSIEVVLEIPGHTFNASSDSGMIRTYKVEFSVG